MAFTFVQKSSAQAVQNAGTTVAPALPVASTGSAGTPHLLIAVLLASSGTWTPLPAGWALAADGVNSATRATVAYCIDTAGGVSSVTFTGSITANLKAYLAEFTAGPGAVITVNASGTAVAGAVAQCSVTTGTAAAAGDLAVCAFTEHFSAGTAITWTDPSGFTLIGSDGGAGGGNHQYGAYNLSAAAGALTVPGKSNVASSLTTGWTGAVATFTTGGSGGGGGTAGLVGAYLSLSIGLGSTTAAVNSAWQALTGRALDSRVVYYNWPLPSAITNDMVADVAAGRKVSFSCDPPWNPPAAAAATALDTFLSSCKAAGLQMDVFLYPEAYYTSAAGR